MQRSTLSLILVAGLVATAHAHMPDQPLGDPVVWVNFETDGTSTHPLAGDWEEAEGLTTAPVHLGTEGAPQGELFGRLAARSEGADRARYVIDTVMRPGVFLNLSAQLRAPARPAGVTTELAVIVSDGRRPAFPVAEIVRQIPPGEEWHRVEIDLDPVRMAGPYYYVSALELRAGGLSSGQSVAMDLDDLLFSGDVDLYFEGYLPRMADEGAAAIRADLIEVRTALDELPTRMAAAHAPDPAVADALDEAARWYADTHARLETWLSELPGKPIPTAAEARRAAVDSRVMRSVLHQASAAGSLDLGGRVAVWQSPPDSLRFALPWDGAVLGTLVDQASLRGAPGEPIICAITVRPRHDASGLVLRPGPLTTATGAVIAPTAWDVHHLLWWWQSPTGIVGGEL
ncbi:MAG: hypothetical protein GF320_05320, partial [Armatimonadia bacterium]|nr:hypothetical protein [Armatimonadia bacterium]